ncbi:MAG: hypothetical protein K2H23_00920 [Oscillospiraceae bacterium]|nr:hypothetical protein [Oscillospiraceae bacterium]
MKVSLIKKSQLTLRLSGMLPRLFVSAFALIYLLLAVSEKTDGEMSTRIIGVSGAIAYSALMSMFYSLGITINFTKIGFFKTLPLTKNDIIDTMFLDSFFSIAITAVIHSIAIAFFFSNELLPYFLCSYLAAFAFSTVLMPFCMKNKRMYNGVASAADSDDEKAVKKATAKGVTVSIGFMVLSVAVSSFIVMRGVTAHDPAGDAVLLTVYAASALLLSGIMIAVCHRMNTFFGN